VTRVIEHLEQYVEAHRMGFFHFIERITGLGRAAHGSVSWPPSS